MGSLAQRIRFAHGEFLQARLSLCAERWSGLVTLEGELKLAKFQCSMWLDYDPVEAQFAAAASQLFDQIWPRSSETVWEDMEVTAADVEEVLQKLRDEFITNLAQLSPTPDKSGWDIQAPLQDHIWWIGTKGHESSSAVEYDEGGVTKQWTMDYGGASPTPIRVYASWKEIRQL
jgi:hypothetical protein